MNRRHDHHRRLKSYSGLDESYQHLVINHAEKYVDSQLKVQPPRLGAQYNR